MIASTNLVGLFLSWFAIAGAVKPGDKYNPSNQPAWWREMKNGDTYGKHLRKCIFEGIVPQNGERCPNIDHGSDHYFCFYGTEEQPTWYCTCSVTDYRFHCSKERVIEEKEIEYAVTVGPGDKYDGYNQPAWWHEMKEDNIYVGLRECVFEGTVPNSCDSCPGIPVGSSHYYCFFGSKTRPTWYCTCSEIDFRFHCSADGAIDPDDIINGSCDSEIPTFLGFAGVVIAVSVISFVIYKLIQSRRGKHDNEIANEAETAKVLAQSHPVI